RGGEGAGTDEGDQGPGPRRRRRVPDPRRRGEVSGHRRREPARADRGRPDRLDRGGVAAAAARAAHRPAAGAQHGRAVRARARHLARQHAGDGREQAGDDRGRRVRRGHDDGDVPGAARQADPRRGRRARWIESRDAGVHRGGASAGDHALPHSGHRGKDGEVPGRLRGPDARGGEAGGGEAAAVNFVPHVIAWNLTRRCNLECAHCYISAGPNESAAAELDTAACLDIVARLRAARLDFIVQTTVTKGNRAELERLVAWSADEGAVSFNCYFLVPTGRGAALSDLTPADYEAVLADLARWEGAYRGRMLVRAKCAPHFMRLVHQTDPESPVLNYETRCPCGTQYCRITPDGKVTPCPYLPEVAGDLRSQRFADVWRSSPLFRRLREGPLQGKCGACEYRAVCGGCRARGFALEGDVLAADPSCLYQPTGDTAVIEPARAVRYGGDFQPALAWTPAARERVARIPS